ncbi:MAG: di-trans,poly-cis-decaprenylcistransferase [Candidatus Lokiarchaeota archaeon]|nr:di-trans,poly-cis-decaprenylcistransferase [Candidatus Lokiarchaeota archaeon]
MEELKKEAKGKLPRHIGLILDGNRRWAKKRNLNMNLGHLAGYETLRKILFSFLDLGIKYLSVFALSNENVKKRSPQELQYIYNLIINVIDVISKDPVIKEEKVRMNVIGRLSLLPPDVREKINSLIETTKDYDQKFLNICIMYDGQEEIIDAVKKILDDKINSKDVNIDLIKNYLYTKDFPELDYIIRTGMEDGARISGFLLWDASYAEFRFRDDYWPDYNEEMLIEDIREYLRRTRRRGK